MLVDLETDVRLEVTSDYARNEYREKMKAHMEALRRPHAHAGHGLLPARNQQAPRRRIARIPHYSGGAILNGFSGAMVSGRALLAGLPVYLHLLRRQTTTPKPFSSLKFFERRTEASVKHRRLRYLLLMSLRLAVLILLVLAFANPFINRTAASISGDKLLLLVVVDDSFSMRAGSRLADAQREAARPAVGAAARQSARRSWRWGRSSMC